MYWYFFSCISWARNVWAVLVSNVVFVCILKIIHYHFFLKSYPNLLFLTCVTFHYNFIRLCKSYYLCYLFCWVVYWHCSKWFQHVQKQESVILFKEIMWFCSLVRTSGITPVKQQSAHVTDCNVNKTLTFTFQWIFLPESVRQIYTLSHSCLIIKTASCLIVHCFSWLN